MDDLLIQMSERVWVVQGRTNTGIIKLNREECLVIDPGQDRDSAKLVTEAFQSLELEPAGVFITHSHADHYGGTHFLKSNNKIEFFASAFESALIEQPILEPIFLYGGAEPIPELTHKFILAKAVPISGRLREGIWEFKGVKFEIVNLPGHSTGQIGLSYDNFLFGGDALTLTKFIEKYKFPFYSDIGKALSTFEYLLQTHFNFFIPGHGQLLDTENYHRETESNRQYLIDLMALVKKCLREAPCTEEELLRKVAIQLETPLVTVVQFVLNRTLILAFLRYLQVSGEVRSFFVDSRWYWQAV